MASIESEKNKSDLFCTNCPSKILLSQVGLLVTSNKDLPKMTQKRDAAEIETDLILESFQVKDPFSFENVGFSNTVKDMKYLVCSDCELGPVGWQDLGTGLCYLALSRVRQGKEDEL